MSKESKAAYMRDYRRRHPGASSKYSAAWAKANPERNKAHKLKSDRRDPVRFFRWFLWKKHHITLEQYEEQLQRQNGCCAICKKPPKDGKRLVVDHDHETGKFRGLLHGECNSGLGMFKDDPLVCLEAAKYLQGAAVNV
jgi:hypothetical protein